MLELRIVECEVIVCLLRILLCIKIVIIIKRIVMLFYVISQKQYSYNTLC